MLGGRWKPLQHFLKESSFAAVAASCDTAESLALCYVRNDLPAPQRLRITVSLFHFQSGQSTVVSDAPVSLSAGAGAMQFFCADAKATMQAPAACSQWSVVLAAAGNCTASSCMLNVI